MSDNARTIVGTSGRMTVSVEADGTVWLTESKGIGGYYMPPEYASELADLLEQAARSGDALNHKEGPMSVLRGIRHIAAYPIRDSEGAPAWQGIVVVEPDDIRWRCPHAHLVDPENKGASHEAAVLCAAEREPDTPRAS